MFDHNLKLLWENTLAKSLPPRSKVREVAVIVTNHSMKTGDRGAVIVGGSLELGGIQDGSLDPLEEADRELRRGRRGAGALLSPEDKAALEEAPEGAEAELAPKRGLDRTHHFNYYAFEGRTGAARWRRASACALAVSRPSCLRGCSCCDVSSRRTLACNPTVSVRPCISVCPQSRIRGLPPGYGVARGPAGAAAPIQGAHPTPLRPPPPLSPPTSHSSESFLRRPVSRPHVPRTVTAAGCRGARRAPLWRGVVQGVQGERPRGAAAPVDGAGGHAVHPGALPEAQAQRGAGAERGGEAQGERGGDGVARAEEGQGAEETRRGGSAFRAPDLLRRSVCPLPRRNDMSDPDFSPRAPSRPPNPQPNQVQSALGKAAGAAGLAPSAAVKEPPHTHAHSLPPNVLVAHLRDGIEAIHLYTGRTVCKLLLQSPELHVDINADGAEGRHVLVCVLHYLILIGSTQSWASRPRWREQS